MVNRFDETNKTTNLKFDGNYSSLLNDEIRARQRGPFHHVFLEKVPFIAP